jgi:small subunit ribosomal protein S6
VGFSVRHYELMVILDPDLEERTIAPSLDRFLSVVTTSGGTFKTEIWGRRRLAYEINKQIEGIYAVIDIQAEPAAVAELGTEPREQPSVVALQQAIELPADRQLEPAQDDRRARIPGAARVGEWDKWPPRTSLILRSLSIHLKR